MIIQQFNESTINQINEGQFKIGFIDYSKNRLNITIINEKEKTQFKLFIDDPSFDNEDFELNHAILSNIFIKDFKHVFNSKYFTCVYAEFIEHNSDNKLVIRSKEVSQ